jgi:Kef-type K+ transport system membrane component KefB
MKMLAVVLYLVLGVLTGEKPSGQLTLFTPTTGIAVSKMSENLGLVFLMMVSSSFWVAVGQQGAPHNYLRYLFQF